MNPRTFLCALAALAASATALAKSKPEMPAFDAALKPFVGTWTFAYKYQDKDPTPLRLVLREHDGKLEIRYEWPYQEKIFPSDWSGICEVKQRLDAKEHHEPVYSIDTAKARLRMDEHIYTTGSISGTQLDIHGYFALSDDGKQLIRTCERVEKDGKQRKEFSCPPPMIYTRLSDSTEWEEK
jgi:hypothetical protein